MYTTQKGFTLIELVVVIVLLGILGVTALGKFQDLSSEAADAAGDGIAAELASATAINYGLVAAGGSGTAVTNASLDCSSGFLANFFATNSFPTGWTPSGPGNTCDFAGDDNTCTITYDSDNSITATATIICTAS